jgi:hypothetical protein
MFRHESPFNRLGEGVLEHANLMRASGRRLLSLLVDSRVDIFVDVPRLKIVEPHVAEAFAQIAGKL